MPFVLGFVALGILAMMVASDGGSAGGSSTPPKPKAPPRPPAEPKSERVRRLKALSRVTGLDVLVLAAIEAVESGGNPAAIRFEPHHFAQIRLGRPQFGPKVVADLQAQAVRDGIPYTPAAQDAALPAARRRGIASLRAAETNADAYRRAVVVDHEAALLATSWGWYQQMGWTLLLEVPGNPAAAEARFWADPKAVSGRLVARGMAKNPKAKQAAADRDWRTFAAIYNGDADAYAPRLVAAYDRAAADPDLTA